MNTVPWTVTLETFGVVTLENVERVAPLSWQAVSLAITGLNGSTTGSDLRV